MDTYPNGTRDLFLNNIIYKSNTYWSPSDCPRDTYNDYLGSL